MPKSEKTGNSPNLSRNIRSRAAVLMATLALGACSSPESSPGVKPVKQEVTTTSPQEKLRSQVKSSAIDKASRILAILERPGSGAEAYNGDTVGNKSASIGPDGVFLSADDNLTPETLVRYYKDKNGVDHLTFKTTREVSVDTPNGDFYNKEFYGVGVDFEVLPGNSILEQTAALGLDDFRKALGARGQIDPIKMEGNISETPTIGNATRISLDVNGGVFAGESSNSYGIAGLRSIDRIMDSVENP